MVACSVPGSVTNGAAVHSPPKEDVPLSSVAGSQRSAAAVLIAVAASACQAEFTVVRDGEAACIVLAPAEQGPRLGAALDDFTHYVGRISGGRIPVVPHEEFATDRNTIRFVVADAPDLPFNGFRMAVGADRIDISAPREAGLVNAVYSLLQDDFGVRWYMPGERFEIVPTRRSLTVPEGVREGRATFFWRVMGGNGTGGGADWLRRNRLDNGVPSIPDWGFGHNLQRILPAETYAREHPEYYVFREGRRCIPGHQVWAIRQACFTNPDVARIGADYAHRFFLEHPEAVQASLSANDNNHYCECPNCRELDEPRPVYEDFRIYSDSYFHWVKAVADRAAETDPAGTLGALAYWNTVVPPRRIERLPDNVVIVMTQDTCQHFDPAYRDRDRAITLEWTHKARAVARYDYGCLTWLTPKYYPHTLADELKYLHGIGVRRYYIEANTHWANAGPGIYMAAQMLWEIGKDPDALLAEYFTALYGEAADEMGAYYDCLEDVWETPRAGRWFQGFMNPLQEFEVWDLANIRRAETLLEKARAAAQTDVVRKRIDYVADGFRFSSLIVEAHATARALHPECFGTADGIVNVLLIISGKIEEALRHADATFTVANHYPQNEYRGDRFRQKRDQWLGDIRDTAARAVAAWLTPESPQDAERRAAQMLEQFSSEPDPRVRAWLLTALCGTDDTRERLSREAVRDPDLLRRVMEVRGGDDPGAKVLAESLCADIPTSWEYIQCLDLCRGTPGTAGRYVSWERARRLEATDPDAAVLAISEFLGAYPTGDTALPAAARLALLTDRIHGGETGSRKCDALLDACNPDPEVRGALDRLRHEGGLWRVCGPFADPGLQGAQAVFPPETDPDPARANAAGDREPAWEAGPLPNAHGFFDLQSVWGDLDRQAAYAQTFLFSPEGLDAVFWIGSDDGVVLWLNGERIHEIEGFRAAVADEDRVPVRLRKGWNRVLLKIIENEGGWGWFFRVSDPANKPLDDAFFAFAPEPEV